MNKRAFEGTVDWIGLRPSKTKPMRAVAEAQATGDAGLADDRFAGGATHRQVTLFQLEHLDTIAKLMGVDQVEPSQTRRNIGVRGINLYALIDSDFEIGECILHATGDCPPCERMETTIGAGGREAMSGLGGITARVVKPGPIRVGDTVRRLSGDAT